MVKKIFYKENFGNDKRIKSRMKVPSGDKAKNKSDRRVHSKYVTKIQKDTVSPYNFLITN